MQKKTPKGLFITFEGIDGCGKTTQALLTYRYLLVNGYQVRLFREPGSTAVAERIRQILLDSGLAMVDVTELLLYEAARAEITARGFRSMPRMLASMVSRVRSGGRPCSTHARLSRAMHSTRNVPEPQAGSITAWEGSPV